VLIKWRKWQKCSNIDNNVVHRTVQYIQILKKISQEVISQINDASFTNTQEKNMLTSMLIQRDFHRLSMETFYVNSIRTKATVDKECYDDANVKWKATF